MTVWTSNWSWFVKSPSVKSRRAKRKFTARSARQFEHIYPPIYTYTHLYIYICIYCLHCIYIYICSLHTHIYYTCIRLIIRRYQLGLNWTPIIQQSSQNILSCRLRKSQKLILMPFPSLSSWMLGARPKRHLAVRLVVPPVLRSRRLGDMCPIRRSLSCHVYIYIYCKVYMHVYSLSLSLC